MPTPEPNAAQDHEGFVDRVQGFAKLLPDYDLADPEDARSVRRVLIDLALAAHLIEARNESSAAQSSEQPVSGVRPSEATTGDAGGRLPASAPIAEQPAAQDQLRRVRESREQTFPALLGLLCDQRRFNEAFDLELRREARLEWEREHGIT